RGRVRLLLCVLRKLTSRQILAWLVTSICGESPRRAASSAALVACSPASHVQADGADGRLHAAGAHIVDASGNEVVLSGVNWFGFETQSFAPHGLTVRNYQSMQDQMVRLGFDTLRLTYSNQLIDPDSVPTDIDYPPNP